MFERYKDGIGRQHNHTVYSATKSVSSALVGALLHQGRLKTVDVPIAQLISKPLFFSRGDWGKGERITLRHVMQMSSGLAYKHDPAGHPIYQLRQDRLAVALSPEQALFAPLQMTNYDWMFMDGAGRYPGGWGLRLRPTDMAKVGQLYLQKGEWNGPGFKGQRIYSIPHDAHRRRAHGEPARPRGTHGERPRGRRPC